MIRIDCSIQGQTDHYTTPWTLFTKHSERGHQMALLDPRIVLQTTFAVRLRGRR